MKILFEKRFLKDIGTIHEKSVKTHLEAIIAEIEDAGQLSVLTNFKKLKGHKSAYRIRIGNYRLGFFYENHTVICTRLLHRKDIYKFFPQP
jgi:mRNA interferase RelE/StbE